MAESVFAQVLAKRRARENEQSGGAGFEAPVHLGLSTLFKEFSGIPGGLARIAMNPGKGLPQLGKGILGSLLSTVSTPFAPLGKLNPVEALGDAVLGEDSVQDFFERSKNRGILPALVEDIGNVALGAGTVTKLAGGAGKAGVVGKALGSEKVLSPTARMGDAIGISAKAAAEAGDVSRAVRTSRVADVAANLRSPYLNMYRKVVHPATREAQARYAAQVIRPAAEALTDAGVLPTRPTAAPAAPENFESAVPTATVPPLEFDMVQHLRPGAAGIERADVSPEMTSFIHRADDGTPTGVLNLDMADGQPTGVTVQVSPAHQRQGIASSLWKAAEDAGLDVESASGSKMGAGYTPDGAAFAHARRARKAEAAVADAPPATAAPALQSPPGWKPQVGKHALAFDRDNFGKVESLDDAAGTATVHFKNRQTGLEETVDMPVSNLGPPAMRRKRAPEAAALAASSTPTPVLTPEVEAATAAFREAEAGVKATTARTPERKVALEARQSAHTALSAARKAAGTQTTPVAPGLADALTATPFEGLRDITPREVPIGPVQRRVEELRSTAPGPAAKQFVNVMEKVFRSPERAQKFLAKRGQKIQDWEYKRIRREQEIFVEAARREALSHPAVLHARAAATQLLEQSAAALSESSAGRATRIDGLTADRMIGDEVRARAYFPPELRAQLANLDPALLRSLGIRGEQIPTALLTPEIDALLDKAAGEMKNVSDQRLSTLMGSSKGAEGLADVGAEYIDLTARDLANVKRAQLGLERAQRHAARITPERTAAAAELAEMKDSIAAVTREIHDLEVAGAAARTEFDTARSPAIFRSPEWDSLRTSLAAAVLPEDLGGVGGFTFNAAQGRALTPKAFGGDDVGWAVSVRDVIEVPVQQWTATGGDVIDMVARTYQDALAGNPDLNIGGWTEVGPDGIPTSVFIDISQTTITRQAKNGDVVSTPITRDQARALGAARRQKTVFDFESGDTIPTTTQRQDVAAQFIGHAPNRDAMAAGLRAAGERIHAGDDAALATWHQVVDAHMDGMDAFAAGRAAANPTRWPTGDDVYRHLKADASAEIPETALLQQTLLSLNWDMKDFRQMLDHFGPEETAKRMNWYFEVNDVIEPFRGIELNFPLADGTIRNVDVAEFMYDALAITSQNTGPLQNLGNALQATVNLAETNRLMATNLDVAKAFAEEMRSFDAGTWEKLSKDAKEQALLTSKVVKSITGTRRNKQGKVINPEVDANTDLIHTYADAQLKVFLTLMERPFGEWDRAFIRDRLPQLLGTAFKKNLLDDSSHMKKIPQEAIDRLGPEQAALEYFGDDLFAKMQSYRDNMANPGGRDMVTLDRVMGEGKGRHGTAGAGTKPGQYLEEATQIRGLADELSALGKSGDPKMATLLNLLRRAPDGSVPPNTVQAGFWAFITDKAFELQTGHLETFVGRARTSLSDGTWTPDTDPVLDWIMEDLAPLQHQADLRAKAAASGEKAPGPTVIIDRPGFRTASTVGGSKPDLPVIEKRLAEYAKVQDVIETALARGDTKAARAALDSWLNTTRNVLKPGGGGSIGDFMTVARNKRVQDLLDRWAEATGNSYGDAPLTTYAQKYMEETLGATIRSGAGASYRAVMRFLTSANPATLVHESGHAIRMILPAEMNRALESFYGVEGSKWSVPAEERFANDVMSYFAGDVAALPTHLRPMAEKVRTAAADVWHAERGEAFRDLTPEMHTLLDGILDPPEIALPHELDTVVQRARADAGVKADAALAKSAEATRLAERKLAVKKSLDTEVKALEKLFEEDALPHALAAAKELNTAERVLRLTERQTARPSVGRVPAHFQPWYHAVRSLTNEAVAGGNEVLAAELAGISTTFQQVLESAKAQGFEPAHIPKMSESQVRQVMFEAARLGGKQGDFATEVASGGRKSRRYAAPQTMDRSIAGLTAGLVDAVKEAQTNGLVTHLEKFHTVDIDKVFGGVIPAGYVAWDAHRTWILTGAEVSDNIGREIAGTSALHGAQEAGTARLAIPKVMADSIRAYGKDYNHPVFDWIRKGTTPWRTMVLYMRPAFYVNNAVGAGIMATKEGVRMTDWLRALQAHRGKPITEATQRRFPKASEAAASANLADDALAFARVSAPGLVETATPLGSRQHLAGHDKIRPRMADAMAEADGKLGKGRAVAREIGISLGRVSAVTDDIARSAVYFSKVRRGVSATDALQIAFSTMLDYGSLSPFERTIVRSAVPFYSFQREILKQAVKFPIYNPAVSGLMLTLGKLNEDLAEDHFGTEMPKAYRNLIPMPGGRALNIGPLVPYADVASLTSPQGIASSMNPFISALIRNAYDAPEQGIQRHHRLGDFGRMVPTTSVEEDIMEELKFLPPLRAAGDVVSGDAAPVARFFGLPEYDDEAVTRIVERTKKGRAQLTKSQ